MSFNEWMAHIYRLSGYPENLIKQYEQSIRRQEDLPKDWGCFGAVTGNESDRQDSNSRSTYQDKRRTR